MAPFRDVKDVESLITRIKATKDPYTQRELLNQLVGSSDPRVLQLSLELVAHSETTVKAGAVGVLAYFEDEPLARAALDQAANDPLLEHVVRRSLEAARKSVDDKPKQAEGRKPEREPTVPTKQMSIWKVLTGWGRRVGLVLGGRASARKRSR